MRKISLDSTVPSSPHKCIEASISTNEIGDTEPSSESRGNDSKKEINATTGMSTLSIKKRETHMLSSKSTDSSGESESVEAIATDVGIQKGAQSQENLNTEVESIIFPFRNDHRNKETVHGNLAVFPNDQEEEKGIRPITPIDDVPMLSSGRGRAADAQDASIKKRKGHENGNNVDAELAQDQGLRKKTKLRINISKPKPIPFKKANDKEGYIEVKKIIEEMMDEGIQHPASVFYEKYPELTSKYEKTSLIRGIGDAVYKYKTKKAAAAWKEQSMSHPQDEATKRLSIPFIKANDEKGYMKVKEIIQGMVNEGIQRPASEFYKKYPELTSKYEKSSLSKGIGSIVFKYKAEKAVIERKEQSMSHPQDEATKRLPIPFKKGNDEEGYMKVKEIIGEMVDEGIQHPASEFYAKYPKLTSKYEKSSLSKGISDTVRRYKAKKDAIPFKKANDEEGYMKIKEIIQGMVDEGIQHPASKFYEKYPKLTSKYEKISLSNGISDIVRKAKKNNLLGNEDLKKVASTHQARIRPASESYATKVSDNSGLFHLMEAANALSQLVDSGKDSTRSAAAGTSSGLSILQEIVEVPPQDNVHIVPNRSVPLDKASTPVAKEKKAAPTHQAREIFPQRLMRILSDANISDVITWLPHGRSFVILQPDEFAKKVLPIYFPESSTSGKKTGNWAAFKYPSFTRKLNRWGIRQVTRGPDAGAFHHHLFIRDEPNMCLQMVCKTRSHRKKDDGKNPGHSMLPRYDYPNTAQQESETTMSTLAIKKKETHMLSSKSTDPSGDSESVEAIATDVGIQKGAQSQENLNAEVESIVFPYCKEHGNNEMVLPNDQEEEKGIRPITPTDDVSMLSSSRGQAADAQDASVKKRKGHENGNNIDTELGKDQGLRKKTKLRIKISKPKPIPFTKANDKEGYMKVKKIIEEMVDEGIQRPASEFYDKYPQLTSKYEKTSLSNGISSIVLGYKTKKAAAAWKEQSMLHPQDEATKRLSIPFKKANDEEGYMKVKEIIEEMVDEGIQRPASEFYEKYPELTSKYEKRSLSLGISDFVRNAKKDALLGNKDMKKVASTQDEPNMCLQMLCKRTNTAQHAQTESAQASDTHHTGSPTEMNNQTAIVSNSFSPTSTKASVTKNLNIGGYPHPPGSYRPPFYTANAPGPYQLAQASSLNASSPNKPAIGKAEELPESTTTSILSNEGDTNNELTEQGQTTNIKKEEEEHLATAKTMLFNSFMKAQEMLQIEAKNGLENYCYSLKTSISFPEVDGKIPADDKTKLEGAIDETLQWLDFNLSAEKEEYEKKQKTLEAIAAPLFEHLKVLETDKCVDNEEPNSTHPCTDENVVSEQSKSIEITDFDKFQEEKAISLAEWILVEIIKFNSANVRLKCKEYAEELIKLGFYDREMMKNFCTVEIVDSEDFTSFMKLAHRLSLKKWLLEHGASK